MRTPRILFASPNLPIPTTHGGNQRTALLLESLKKIGEVDCFYLPAQLPTPQLLSELHSTSSVVGIQPTDQIRQEATRTISYIPTRALKTFISGERHKWTASSSLREAIGNLHKYDLVITRYLSPACILGLFEHPNLVIDVDDYDPDRLEMRIKNSGPFKNMTLRRCLTHSRKAHFRELPKAQAHFVSNPHDRNRPGLKDACHLPNIPYFRDGILPEVQEQNTHAKNFLMVGTLSYSANVDGLNAFLKSAWPVVIERHPDASLTIVGRGLPPKKAAHWSAMPSIQLAGFVDDLAPLYNNCLATISPMLAGGGTNIKVLESAAYGRVPILSKVAHRGFEHDFQDRESCLVVDEISEMADQCCKLLNRTISAKKVGQKAREIVEKKYQFSSFEHIILQTIETVLNPDAQKRK